MKEKTSAEWYHEVRGIKPLRRDDELLQLVKDWYMGHPPSGLDVAMLADAGYICEKTVTFPWEPTPCCEAFIEERDPEFMWQLREQAEREKHWVEAAEVALRLDLLRCGSLGYFSMTRRGRAVDGIQLLHALIDPDMPFVTLAVQFDGCIDFCQAEAMEHRLYDGKQEWVRMRKRILAGLTDDERMLVGLPPTEEPSDSDENMQVVGIPRTYAEVEMEQKVKDLILKTARRLKGG